MKYLVKVGMIGANCAYLPKGSVIVKDQLDPSVAKLQFEMGFYEEMKAVEVKVEAPKVKVPETVFAEAEAVEEKPKTKKGK